MNIKVIEDSGMRKEDDLATIGFRIQPLNELRDAIYQDAVAHGLWEATDETVKNVIEKQEKRGFPFKEHVPILRSWAVELIRREVAELDMASDSENEYAEELADIIIVSLSVAGRLGIDIDAAVCRKMEINKGRPWKHGRDGQQKDTKGE